MKPKGILTLTGKKLRCSAMPLGGIGTGSIAIGGDGLLKQWQINNKIDHRSYVPNCFFAVRTRQLNVSDGKIITRALISSKPHEGPNFIPAKSIGDHRISKEMKKLFNALPQVENIQFDGEYPILFLQFKDALLPIEIKLTAFNPFIPLDPKNSGLPVIIFQFQVKNISKENIEVIVLGNLLNFIGWDGLKTLRGDSNPLFGGNLNIHKRVGNWNVIHMKSKLLLKTDKRYGDLTLAIDQPDAMVSTQWEDLENFWSQFSQKGVLMKPSADDMSKIGKTYTGSLAAKKILKPEEKTVITFYLAWNFPNRFMDWRLNRALFLDTKTEYWIGNRYNEWFNNSIKLIEYVRDNRSFLLDNTFRFHEDFFYSTLPSEVLTSISATFSTIRTPTCLWIRNGSFYGFEGCNGVSTGKRSGGSCPLNCTHVWNYEFSLAHLFPTLERTMRATEFKTQHKLGYLPHRAVIPLYLPQFEMIPDPGDVPPAIDGMFGMILKIYRDFLISGDLKFLEESWPNIQSLMEYILKDYDNDLDGVISCAQPNTYDCSIYGINTFIGSLYLVALFACEQIATKLSLEDWAKKCRDLFDSGRKILDKECWNGEYYIQKFNEVKIKENQYGIGCFSDQLVGQWWAFHLGFGYILPAEHVNKAIESIVKYNFKESLEGISQTPRIFASPTDSGLLNCTWPYGNKPKVPTYYIDEVWTGLEYEIAALCIYTNRIDEGLTIINSIRKRYDGSHRSPWNEVECGDHYVRPMSSWTLLHALTGIFYSVELKQLVLAPRINPTNFQSFFITNTAWGKVNQDLSERRLNFSICVSYGNLNLKSILLKSIEKLKPDKIKYCKMLGSEKEDNIINAKLIHKNSDIEISLSETISIKENQKLLIELI